MISFKCPAKGLCASFTKMLWNAADTGSFTVLNPFSLHILSAREMFLVDPERTPWSGLFLFARITSRFASEIRSSSSSRGALTASILPLS